jgi:outer membrane protein OmpA-like peptidoglycan-associated protein
LSSIVELLQRNPTVTIEISAHTDDVGTDEYNLDLSNKRAFSVTNYLRNHGVPSSQLVAKGYGKSRPLVENTSDENRAKNRRVELVVLDVK